MELLGIGMLLFLSIWLVFTLHSKPRSAPFTATVFYSIRSIEKDVHGIEEESINLRKQITLPLPVHPGMEFDGVANSTPILIERVVISPEGCSLHLKPSFEPRAKLEETKKWYKSRGWHCTG